MNDVVEESLSASDKKAFDRNKFLNNERIIWVDVETSGIDPKECALIQVAAIVTDGHLNEISDPFERKIYYSESEVSKIRSEANEFVQNMHDKNGLWNSLPVEGESLEKVDEDLKNFLAEYTEYNTARLGGNSITLDRNFLSEFLPNAFEHIHYRSYDLTSISGWFELYDPNYVPFEKNSNHEALGDIRASIAEGRYYAAIINKTMSPF